MELTISPSMDTHGWVESARHRRRERTERVGPDESNLFRSRVKHERTWNIGLEPIARRSGHPAASPSHTPTSWSRCRDGDFPIKLRRLCLVETRCRSETWCAQLPAPANLNDLTRSALGCKRTRWRRPVESSTSVWLARQTMAPSTRGRSKPGRGASAALPRQLDLSPACLDLATNYGLENVGALRLFPMP